MALVIFNSLYKFISFIWSINVLSYSFLIGRDLWLSFQIVSCSSLVLSYCIYLCFVESFVVRLYFVLVSI